MRSKRAPKRLVKADPIYDSQLVTKLINRVMRDGKKTVASTLVYKALDQIEKSGKKPLSVLDEAMSNVSPRMEVRPRRVGGASYQVPVEVKGDRRETLAIRWIIDAARSKSNKEFHTFSEKLAQELLDAAEGKGLALKKKEEVLRVAESNKAFAHFRW